VAPRVFLRFNKDLSGRVLKGFCCFSGVANRRFLAFFSQMGFQRGDTFVPQHKQPT
jgi:hypothetical protein